MSLLTMIQGVAQERGIPVPTQVIGNTDAQVIQLLAIAQKEGRDLAARYQWSTMVKRATWTMLTAESQGLLNSAVITDGDFDYFLDGTMWDTTTQLPIPGPLSPKDWETLQAVNVSGPEFFFRIFQRTLYLYPAPTAANTGALEYKSTFWCETSGGTGQAKWTADTDVGILNENLMELGITWRWLKTKGLEYAEDFDTYEKRVANAQIRDGGKPRLNLGTGPIRRGPGVVVPLGNWLQ